MNKVRYAECFKSVLNLEWLGIHIEDTKEVEEKYGITKTICMYSVPESSTIEVEDKDLNERIKTSDGLKYYAKEILSKLFLDSCREAYPDDEEFINEIECNFSSFFKFYCKVRKGEVWNKEMGDKQVEEICKDIENAAQYKEV